MSYRPKIMHITPSGSGPQATYIGNNNLSRESRGKSANNIVRAAEHASRMRINLSSGTRDICAHKRNNLARKPFAIHARAATRLFFFPLSLAPSLSHEYLARKWFSRGNKQATRIPVRNSRAYVTFQSRCTGTLPLCFTQFHHARKCKRESDPMALFPHYCYENCVCVLTLVLSFNLRSSRR